MVLSVISLSQAHLMVLETCPRRFQYVFDQALAIPPTPQNQEAALWGSQFHLLMQQQALGLPIAVMTAADDTMMATVEALKQQAPHLFQPELTETLRQSEHQRTLAFNGYLLTVIYDLVILTAQTGLIVDWKTYLKPPDRDRLVTDWQTRLYLYVLAETSGLSPEQITMAYWFVRHRNEQQQVLPPTAYHFSYSLRQHQQTRVDLQRLTDRLSNLRQHAGEFPKTDCLDRCDRCPFQVRCQRLAVSELPLNLNTIDEIPLS